MSATGLLFRSQSLRRRGEAAAALEAAERAAAAAPASPHVALHHALALADAGRLEPALEELAQAARRWPANPVFPLFRGALLAEGGELDQAEAALAAAQQHSPDNRLVIAYQALIAIRRGDAEEGLRRLAAAGYTDNTRALAALLTEVEAVLLGRFGVDTDPCLPRSDEAQAAPRGSPSRLLAAGIDRLEKGDPAAARPLLRAAAEQNPSLRDVFAYLGFACFDLGDYPQALEALSRVGPWSPLREAVHLHRGATLYKLGRFEEAVEELEKADEADELDEYATYIHFYLGRALIALGRREEARTHLRAFFELEGDLAMGRLRQARELLGLAVPDTAPKGFDVLRESKTTLVVKSGYAEAIRQRAPAGDGQEAHRGRGPVQRIQVPGGVALVRHCRRGGSLGRILGDLYLDGSRFLHEVGVADALWRRGVPTPEMLAGIRREPFPGLYRADIVTREVPGARDLAQALREAGTGDPASVQQALSAVAGLLRQMHDAGLDHPDLNARNLLLAPDGKAFVVDLDRAELVDLLPLRDRLAAVARLYRSLHKLRLAPRPVDDEAWRAFYQAYAQGKAELEDHAETAMRRCRAELRRHRLWWRLTCSQARDRRASRPHD
ncbi:MAG: lipopolysaccharide kinase InaA family protein [Candidatus Brocadiia bacterium]